MSRRSPNATRPTSSRRPRRRRPTPNTERRVIQAGVDCCYFPLYEVERGITKITYDPEAASKKLPAADWLGMMGRTKHLMNERYADVVQAIQNEIDHRWLRLKARNDCELL